LTGGQLAVTIHIQFAIGFAQRCNSWVFLQKPGQACITRQQA
jgi:hypothetical protein